MASGSLLALVGIEWALDTYFPVGGQLYVPDAGLLYDAAPNAARIQRVGRHYVREGDATHVHVRTGKEGYRGGDLENPKRRTRVLVLGDSMVMAEYAPLERTFVARLGAELEAQTARPDSIETVNAGRAGYGPDQTMLLFERDADLIQPDVVVCVLCAHNDFGDLMRNKLFLLDGKSALQKQSPTIGQRMRDRFERIGRWSQEPAIQRLWRFWSEARRTPAIMRPMEPSELQFYVEAMEAQAREHLVDRDPEILSLFEDVYDIDMAAPGQGQFNEPKRALMTAILARLALAARRREVPLVFVIVPSAVDVCEQFGVKMDPIRFPSYEPTRLVETHAGCVGLAGGIAIDVTPALTADGPADRFFIGGTDIHWNAAGQGAAAAFIAQQLLRNPETAAVLDPTAPR